MKDPDNKPLSREEQLKKIGELIKGIRIAMLTTECKDGTLRARPMAAQDWDFDGTLWFFVREHSPKMAEIGVHQQVNVTFTDTGNNRYVSLSGRGKLIRDGAKIKEYWREWHKAWFPQGLEDPELAMLRIEVTQAEYWDGPGMIGSLIGMATAYLTGQEMESSGHKKVQI